MALVGFFFDGFERLAPRRPDLLAGLQPFDGGLQDVPQLFAHQLGVVRVVRYVSHQHAIARSVLEVEPSATVFCERDPNPRKVVRGAGRGLPNLLQLDLLDATQLDLHLRALEQLARNRFERSGVVGRSGDREQHDVVGRGALRSSAGNEREQRQQREQNTGQALQLACE